MYLNILTINKNYSTVVWSPYQSTATTADYNTTAGTVPCLTKRLIKLFNLYFFVDFYNNNLNSQHELKDRVGLKRKTYN